MRVSEGTLPLRVKPVRILHDVAGRCVEGCQMAVGCLERERERKKKRQRERERELERERESDHL